MQRLVDRRGGERGFALMLVLAMAAAVALLLYKELPRAVFESQRVKEDILTERGEQYKTGVRRFYQKFRKFPQTLDELDNTNGQRFLRRRYKDPFTGKEEWKIIKMDAAGNLIDSVQSKKSVTDKDKQGGTGSVSVGHSLGDASNQPGEQEGPDVTKKRASDKGIGADLALQQYQQREQGSGPPDPNNPSQGAQGPTVQAPPGSPQFPGVPVPQYQTTGQQALPGQPGFSPGVTPIPGQQFPPGTLPPGLQLPGMVPQQAQGGSAMAQQGLGGGSSMAQVGLGGGPAQTGPGGSFGRPGFNPLQGVPQPGVANSQAPNQGAIQAIQNQLTNPGGAFGAGRTVGTPGPANGQLGGIIGQVPGAVGGAGGMFGGGGIVGFASKHKGEGIKLIEERSKINEWEFIYDPRKDKRITGATGGGLPGSNPNGTPPSGSAPGGSSSSSGSGFGTSSFGSSTTRK